jgi:predicted O-methyltransferase YrrM
VIAERLALMREVLRDPPQVHAATGAPGGVWRSDAACYRFLAESVERGSRTLETGCGISTVLLTAWGATHSCVVASGSEVEVVKAYLDERDIDRTLLTFVQGPSEELLPLLRPRLLDAVFIDGSHGFPAPIIDWFYAARWLRQGGVLVVDDMNLPSVSTLGWFLKRDPRWERVTEWPATWAGFVRRGSGDLAEDWEAQPFLGEPA